MKKCKLDHECADNAKACPICGHRFTSQATKVIAGLFGLLALVAIIGGSISNSPPTASTASPQPIRANLVAALAKEPGMSKAASLCTAHQDWSIRDCKSVAAKEIYIGMGAIQVRASWGKPKSVNRTITTGGHSEQWVYSCQYVYFEADDKVSSMQDAGCPSP